MDLRQYFRKLREAETNMPDAHVFVTSLETPDGGRPGIITEVPRDIAAKMLVEGRAVLSTKQEKEHFLEAQRIARAAAQRAEIAQRLQVTVVPEDETLRLSQHSESTSRPAPKK